MLRVYAQSHRRHRRRSSRLHPSGAGGATVRRYRGRIICTMLKCPPRKETLRAGRCAGSLIARTDNKNSGPISRARAHPLSVFSPYNSCSLLAL